MTPTSAIRLPVWSRIPTITATSSTNRRSHEVLGRVPNRAPGAELRTDREGEGRLLRRHRPRLRPLLLCAASRQIYPRRLRSARHHKFGESRDRSDHRDFLDGAPHNYNPRFPEIQRALNARMDTPMVQHGGEAQFTYLSEQPIHVFFPRVRAERRGL
jgi:hypothetical protein